VAAPFQITLGEHRGHVTTNRISTKILFVHRVDHLGRNEHRHRGSLRAIASNVLRDFVAHELTEDRFELRHVLHEIALLPEGALPFLAGYVFITGQALPIWLMKFASESIGIGLFGARGRCDLFVLHVA